MTEETKLHTNVLYLIIHWAWTCPYCDTRNERVDTLPKYYDEVICSACGSVSILDN